MVGFPGCHPWPTIDGPGIQQSDESHVTEIPSQRVCFLENCQVIRSHLHPNTRTDPQGIMRCVGHRVCTGSTQTATPFQFYVRPIENPYTKWCHKNPTSRPEILGDKDQD